MKIGICTPCYDGAVNNDHMRSAVETDRLGCQIGIEIEFYHIPGNANLPRMRNMLVATALAANCDWIVMVDADIAWNASDLFKMVKHGPAVVAAGPPKRHNRWDEKAAAIAKIPAGDIIGIITDVGRLWRVDGAATAFMAIHSNVFKYLEPQTIEYHVEGMKVRTWFWFDLSRNGSPLLDEGEDYNFCRKFIAAGGSVWIDPDIRVRHYSGTVCHDVCFADSETMQEPE